MKNKEIKRIIDSIAENYPMEPNMVEALKIASSKMTSPWNRTEYKMPSKPGMYLCAVKPRNVKNVMPYTVDVYRFDFLEEVSGEGVKYTSPEMLFFRWDEQYSTCIKPDVLAWMPIPKFYNNKYVAKETSEDAAEYADQPVLMEGA